MTLEEAALAYEAAQKNWKRVHTEVYLARRDVERRRAAGEAVSLDELRAIMDRMAAADRNLTEARRTLAWLREGKET